MHESAHDILIVDDNPESTDLVRIALKQKGFKSRTAANGEAALSEVAKKMPDLILLDMRMPVMDGWEFSRRFYNLYGRSTPIVIITADEDSELRANEIGADSYIGKPFDADDLARVVEAALCVEEGAK